MTLRVSAPSHIPERSRKRTNKDWAIVFYNGRRSKIVRFDTKGEAATYRTDVLEGRVTVTFD